MAINNIREPLPFQKLKSLNKRDSEYIHSQFNKILRFFKNSLQSIIFS